MMIIMKSGDLLKSNCDIIAHQVNVYACMGGGIARQIADKYYNTNRLYIRYCGDLDNDETKLLGNILYTTEDDFVIANLFSQSRIEDERGSITDYSALRECLVQLKEYAQDNSLTLGLPYGIGCGIAGGNWDIVYKIIEEVFMDYDVEVYEYNL